MIYIVQDCPNFEHSLLVATTRSENSCLDSQSTRNSENLHQFRGTTASLHLFDNLSTPPSPSPPARGSGDAARRGASNDACNKRRTWCLPRITPSGRNTPRRRQKVQLNAEGSPVLDKAGQYASTVRKSRSATQLGAAGPKLVSTTIIRSTNLQRCQRQLFSRS